MSFKDLLNKHYTHTQNSVKKYEVGGKVVTKKGATNDAKKGGYFDGRPHSEGGIKAINIDNNQPIEVEGGEVVITKRAVADNTKKEFQGKMMTNKEILSKINESGGGVSFAKGGEVKLEEDDYYISDDDLNFPIDEKEFADGGTIPLPEIQQRILEIIVNSPKPQITYNQIQDRYSEKFPTEFGIYKERDEVLDAVLEMLDSKVIISGPKGYELTPDGYDKIEEIRRENLNTKTTLTNETKVIIPENQQRILEIIINYGKPKVTYDEIRDKYEEKFPTNKLITEVVDALREALESNLIVQVSEGMYKAYKISPLGFDKIEEIRQSNREANNQKSNENSGPLEIESIRVLISNIKDPEGSKYGITNKYRGQYQKVFQNIATFDNVEEDIVYYGKDGGNVNDFYVKIINPKFKIDSESAIKEINKLNRVSVTDIIYKNSPSTEGVQTNPLFEEFPYFAPDAVQEYNPQVLTVQPRSLILDASLTELKNKISEKQKIIRITSQLLQDVPVENVLERVEMSLLLNAEQKELDLLANPTLNKLPFLKRTNNKNALDQLIDNARVEQKNLQLPRTLATETNMLGEFDTFIEYCAANTDSYIANWLVNFFGNWVFYSDLYNFDYSLLNDKNNLPDAMSRVGRVQQIQIGNTYQYMYVPQIVFQGLSKVYDRVGFDVFPISYYAVNYSYANWFATTKGQNLGTEGVILPCILNIRRPLDLSFFGIEKVSPTKFFDAIYLQTGLSPQELKVSPAFLSDSTPDLEVWVYIRNNVEMLKILKETKICDGIHMYENNPAVDMTNIAYQTEVWITFYPEQTKVVPLYQFRDFKQDGFEMERGWFSKSQFLKSGGTI